MPAIAIFMQRTAPSPLGATMGVGLELAFVVGMLVAIALDLMASGVRATYELAETVTARVEALYNRRESSQLFSPATRKDFHWPVGSSRPSL